MPFFYFIQNQINQILIINCQIKKSNYINLIRYSIMNQLNLRPKNPNNEAPSSTSYSFSNFSVQSLPHTYKQQLIRICRYLQQQQLNPYAEQHPINRQIIPSICVNICALFQCVRILHFFGKYEVPYPSAIKALQIVNYLLNTCQIPCINLIQTYLLPSMYKVARHYSQQQKLIKQKQKNSITSISSLKQSNNQNQNKNMNTITKKNYKNNAKQRLMQEYQSGCFQLIVKWAFVRSRKVYQNYQIGQNSLFYQFMISIVSTYMGKYNTNTQQFLKRDYKYIISKVFPHKAQFLIQQITKLKTLYVQNLQKYGNHQTNSIGKQYSSYFMQMLLQQEENLTKQQDQQYNQLSPTKIYEQLTHPNKLQNIMKYLPKLDITLIFKTLDPVLIYPTNQKLFNILEKQQNDLSSMTLALRLVTKLIVWGDLETYFNVVYSEEIQTIAKQVLKIKGYISVEQGQNIMPQIKQQQKTTKIQFYKQLLNFLQVFSVCKIPQLDKQLGQIPLRKIFQKIHNLNYILPTKSQGNSLQGKFIKNREMNNQRNQTWFKNIQQMNVKQSIKSKSMSLSLENISKNTAIQNISGKMEQPVTNNANANGNKMSVTVLEYLKLQIVDMIQSLQCTYQQTLQLLDQQKQLLLQRKIKNQIKSSTKINTINKKIRSIKKQAILLKQQIIINQKQTDQQIKNYLQQVTIKAKSVLQRVGDRLYLLELAYRDILEKNTAEQKMILQASHYSISQPILQINNVQVCKNPSITMHNNIQIVNRITIQSQTQVTQPPKLPLSQQQWVRTDSELQNKQQVNCTSFNIGQLQADECDHGSVIRATNSRIMNNYAHYSKINCNNMVANNDIPSLVLSTNQQKKHKQITHNTNIIQDYNTIRPQREQPSLQITQQQPQNIDAMIKRLSLQKKSSTYTAKIQNRKLLKNAQAYQNTSLKTNLLKQQSTKIDYQYKCIQSPNRKVNCPQKEIINIPNIPATVSIDQIVMPLLVPGVNSFPQNQDYGNQYMYHVGNNNGTQYNRQHRPKTFKDCIRGLQRQYLIPNYKVQKPNSPMPIRTPKYEHSNSKRKSNIKSLLKYRSKSNNNIQLRQLSNHPQTNNHIMKNQNTNINNNNMNNQGSYDISLGINTKIQANQSHRKCYPNYKQNYHPNPNNNTTNVNANININNNNTNNNGNINMRNPIGQQPSKQQEQYSPYSRSRIHSNSGSRIKLTRIRSQSELNPNNCRSSKRSYITITKNLIQEKQQQNNTMQPYNYFMQTIKKQKTPSKNTNNNNLPVAVTISNTNSPRATGLRPNQLSNQRRQTITHCQYYLKQDISRINPISNNNNNTGTNMKKTPNMGIFTSIATQLKNTNQYINKQSKVEQIRNRIMNRPPSTHIIR